MQDRIHTSSPQIESADLQSGLKFLYRQGETKKFQVQMVPCAGWGGAQFEALGAVRMLGADRLVLIELLIACRVLTGMLIGCWVMGADRVLVLLELKC